MQWQPIKRAANNRLAVVRALLVWQFSLCVIQATAALFISVTAAYSVLLGGLICLIPNCYFAYKAFQYEGARAARQILRSFYRGEAGKIVLTTVLFALVFAGVKPLNAMAVFAGYCAVMSLSWFVPILYGKLAN